MVVLFFIFEDPPYCSPLWLYPFTFPPIAHGGSFIPHSCQHLLFFNNHSDRCEGEVEAALGDQAICWHLAHLVVSLKRRGGWVWSPRVPGSVWWQDSWLSTVSGWVVITKFNSQMLASKYLLMFQVFIFHFYPSTYSTCVIIIFFNISVLSHSPMETVQY